jgi:serine/threonine-protein kinase
LLFVAIPDGESDYDDILIYNTKKKDAAPIGAIRDGVSQPQSACMDGDGMLYVLNGVGSGWISEYPLGSTSPSKMITQGVDEPAFCAIDSSGNLWITNVGSVNLTEYLKDSSTPNKVITSGLSLPVGVAIDHLGTIYVANRGGGNNTNIQVYPFGSTSPSRTITDGIHWPIGIALDAAGNLFVPNLVPGNLREYLMGSSKPYRTVTRDMNGPSAVTFAPNGWLYLTNTGTRGGGSGPASAILEFPPNSKVPSKRMITQGLYAPLGTAYYPPALP